jgi:hypothetical protein
MRTCRRLMCTVGLLAAMSGVARGALVTPYGVFTAGNNPEVLTTYAPVSADDLIDSSEPTLASQSITGFPDPNPAALGTPAMLNDGAFGTGPDTGYSQYTGTFLDDDDDGDGVYAVTYNLDIAVNALGYTITAIDSYTAYAPSRSAQQYKVTFTHIDNTTSELQIGYGPTEMLGSAYAATKVHLVDDTGALATGVKSVRFDVQKHPDFSGSTYREFDVFGQAVPEPASLACLAGGGLLMLRRRRSL